jgi:hypothetical protein
LDLLRSLSKYNQFKALALPANGQPAERPGGDLGQATAIRVPVGMVPKTH